MITSLNWENIHNYIVQHIADSATLYLLFDRLQGTWFSIVYVHESTPFHIKRSDIRPHKKSNIRYMTPKKNQISDNYIWPPKKLKNPISSTPPPPTEAMDTPGHSRFSIYAIWHDLLMAIKWPFPVLMILIIYQNMHCLLHISYLNEIYGLTSWINVAFP